MLNKLTGIDVFDIALAFNPVNKKKFFTVKDGAVKPVVVAKDEPVVTDPPAPVVEPAVAAPVVPVVDPPAPAVEPAAVTEPVVPTAPVAKDAPAVEATPETDPLKTFKDAFISMKDQMDTMKSTVDKIVGVLKDATMLPAEEPDKDTIKKDDNKPDVFWPY